VAAAAFAPCVAAAAPQLLDLESFLPLERINSLDATFDRPSYLKWKALRETEDARFMGLAVPRILMRAPYPDTPLRCDGFIFREETAGDAERGFLWGNAAFAFAEVAIRAFQQSGWLASVRGVRPGEVTAGFVHAPDPYCFDTDSRNVAPRTCTDVVITEAQDRLLSEAGFMPLCDLKGTGDAAFYSSLSIQRPKAYDTKEATQNAKISGMLHYMLCVSQFARQIKVLARDMIGGLTEVSELEQRLNKWLSKYVTFDDSATPDVKAKFPLRHARVRIKERAEHPGSYDMTVHLQPHYELDDMSAAVQLTTRFARDGRSAN
jgi:type VI secretion system ImpC/EvpB family protein